MEELIPGLQPLVLWMANSIELLHFIQHEVPQLLPWRQDRWDEGGVLLAIFKGVSSALIEDFKTLFIFFTLTPDLLQSEMSSTRTACEEAMTVLEEVIMFTFQQSVYYLTKVRSHIQAYTA